VPIFPQIPNRLTWDLTGALHNDSPGIKRQLYTYIFIEDCTSRILIGCPDNSRCLTQAHGRGRVRTFKETKNTTSFQIFTYKS
jgi:hypothetical protein